MLVVAPHCLVVSVVEHHGEERQIGFSGHAETLGYRVIEETAVAHQGNHRTVGHCQLDAQGQAQSLAQAAVGMEIALRPLPLDVTHNLTPMGSNLLNKSGIVGHYLAQGGAQPNRVNGLFGAGRGFHRQAAFLQPVMLRRPMLPPFRYLGSGRALGRSAGFQGFVQQLQRDGQVPFHVHIGQQVLISHLALKGIFSQGDNGSGGRAGMGRVPGRPAPQQQHQVGLVKEGFRIAAQIHRMALGEVRVGGSALDYRNSHQLGQLDQIGKSGYFLSRTLGDNQGTAAVGNQVGQPLQGFRRRLGLRGLGNLANLCRRRPTVNHGFDGNIQIGWALGHPLRHFPGPHQLLIKGVGAGGLAAPLDKGIHKAVGAADHAQIAIPLALGV